MAEDFSTAWDLFARATRRARSRAASDSLDGSGLTLAQYQMLEPLLAEREMTVSALAGSAGVAAPTATRMLDALVRDGVAERAACDSDRRLVHVNLTRAGRAAVRAAGERVEAARGRVRATLTEEEQAQAAVLLRKLATAMDAL